MLSKIDNTAMRNTIKEKFTDENLDYIRKLGIIQEAIYGVDIQTIAVEISKLRCFLTLVVDEDVDDKKPNRGIIPLPNLEFKFIAANTLIGLPKKSDSKAAGDLFDADDEVAELKFLREEYFRSFGKQKEKLEQKFIEKQKQIATSFFKKQSKDQAIIKLANWNPFTNEKSDWFDPDWMFGINSGFDIIIANPPYVGEKGHKHIFQEIKNSSLTNFYQGKTDLFYYFFHLALNLGSENSSIAFITTNYYMTATGGNKLREDFKKRATITRLINFNELRIFESAQGQHNMITVLRKGQNERALSRNCISKRRGDAKPELLQTLIEGKDPETNYYQVIQEDLYDGENYNIRISGVNNSENPFNNIFKEVVRQSVPITDLYDVKVGLRTGIDKISEKHLNIDTKYNVGESVFIISKEDLIKFPKSEKALIKPLYKNSDIQRWRTSNDPDCYVIYSNKNTEINLFPHIKAHLNKYKPLIKKIRTDDGEIWYSIVRPREERIFLDDKIVCPQRSKKNTFAYNDKPFYASSDVYFIVNKDGVDEYELKYVLALLNSKLFYLWLYYRGKRKGETLELYQQPLSEIPIKKASAKIQKLFIKEVDKILSNVVYGELTEKKEIRECEDKIDLMVCKIYNLPYDDVKIINPNFVKYVKKSDYDSFELT